jgi:hypothetical protein
MVIKLKQSVGKWANKLGFIYLTSWIIKIEKIN